RIRTAATGNRHRASRRPIIRKGQDASLAVAPIFKVPEWPGHPRLNALPGEFDRPGALEYINSRTGTDVIERRSQEAVNVCRRISGFVQCFVWFRAKRMAI